MKKQILSEEFKRMQKLAGILNEKFSSYQEASGRLKEFAEGLKSHLEKKGYTIMDNTDSEVVDKRNIIFSFNTSDGPAGEVLYVYYDENNNEEISSIVNYLDYFNKSKFGLDSKAAAYTTALQKGFLVWHLNARVTKDGDIAKIEVGNLVKFLPNHHFKFTKFN